jgi:hypothetical protein
VAFWGCYRNCLDRNYQQRRRKAFQTCAVVVRIAASMGPAVCSFLTWRQTCGHPHVIGFASTGSVRGPLSCFHHTIFVIVVQHCFSEPILDTRHVMSLSALRTVNLG